MLVNFAYTLQTRTRKNNTFQNIFCTQTKNNSLDHYPMYKCKGFLMYILLYLHLFMVKNIMQNAKLSFPTSIRIYSNSKLLFENYKLLIFIYVPFKLLGLKFHGTQYTKRYKNILCYYSWHS